VTPRTYATPAAYKFALEARIAAEAKTRAMPINRVRQLLVAERLLARVMQHFGDRVVAKGGLVLELRLARARATKDVDLRLTGSADSLLGELRKAAALVLGDFLAFHVEEDPDQPTMGGGGVVYEGRRYVARAELAGKIYGSRFRTPRVDSRGRTRGRRVEHAPAAVRAWDAIVAALRLAERVSDARPRGPALKLNVEAPRCRSGRPASFFRATRA
jgi:hypothetical protein